MSLILITAPPVKPVTQQEAWDHLRVNLTQHGIEPADKDRIDLLIASATDYLDGQDGILGRQMVTATWDLSLDGFPARDFIALPLPPRGRRSAGRTRGHPGLWHRGAPGPAPGAAGGRGG